MPDPNLNRRQFGKHAAASALLLGAASGSSAEADDHQPAIAEPIPPQSIPVDLLLLEVVRQLFPERKLTRPILGEIRRDIRSDLRRSQAIREVPLNNANEPAALFAAYREE